MSIETVTSETLQEFNNDRMRVSPAPKAPEPKTEAPAEPAVAADPAVEVDPAAEPTDPPADPAPKKGNHKIESRFSELTAKARAAEERAVAAEARATAAEAKAAPEKAPAIAAERDAIGPEPKAADYTDAFDYAKDLAEWSTSKALHERDKADAEREQNKVREKVVDGWKTRVEAIKAEKPDWAEMIASSKGQVCDAARDSLIESEFGPRIVYDLAEDDELAAKVSAMKPADQVKWIGKQEAKYEAAAETKSEPKEERVETIVRERPRAPAPITPVRGTRTEDVINSPGEFKGTYAEYKAARQRQRA